MFRQAQHDTMVWYEIIRKKIHPMQAKILAVIAPERFRDEELFVPQAFLTEKGWDVTIASTKTGVATGMLGGTATATITIGQADASDYQALIVVGGYGSVEF